MDQETFAAVDEFIAGALAPDDEALRAALEAADAAGLPAIQVSPPQGKLLQLLARMQGARTVLEIGTLGGYSTILLARALQPGGRLITLEANADFAAVAGASIERAGLGDVVEIRVGPALETLMVLDDEGIGPFDLVFIDADKVNTPAYFAWALDRTRPGGLIFADNVVRDGTLADAASPDPVIHAQRRLHAELAEDSRVSATTIQTVGSKGYDGFTIGLVEG